MALGEQIKFTSPWFRLGNDGPRERFICRYPTTTEYLDYVSARSALLESQIKPDGSGRDVGVLEGQMLKEMAPLVESYEIEDGQPPEDWREHLSDPGPYADLLAEIGGWLFRGATFESPIRAVRSAGGPGVPKLD
jgi:hypothetical protein